ncbi:cytochrome c biogenesis protein CCS1, chloroplastic-like [Chenopodium quinoa]|uniref:cytochrome c biogenesis protein CCS1, chloroplastic-like n=1 Tax=Chenopodium quinoa TaxID=63459 RepID=UPI000B795A2B|nr:cytochrome c biogenesis protein CCS1, chloroplastic-like [Chenopodium quinoa]XP_021731095.1 cytochrome c biogenesis protein CCS1, chloroplastic-like [Chenopodium quinoa]
MAPLKLNGDKSLFGSFLPIGNDDSQNVKGISMLARDLQSIVLYDQDGKFVGTDPGVPVVYAGFGALMLTCISYLFHAQGLPNYRRYRDPEANLVRPEEPEDVPMEDRNLAGDGNSNSDDFSNDSAGSDYSENYYTGSEH